MKKITAFFAITFLLACSKNDEIVSPENSKPKVYVVGTQSNGTKDVAKLWVDGSSIALSDGTQNTNVYSVFVSNSNDVYVAGNEYVPGQNDNGESYLACIWKNNQKIILQVNPEQYSVANDVFVTDNNDVYAVGTENNGVNYIAKLWKNGVGINLTDGSTRAEAQAVFVSGDDVYVVGYKYENRTDIAMLWKNGVETRLTNGFNRASALDVFVVGNDVHIVGYTLEGNRVPKYWKNGQEISLPSAQITGSSYAKAIFIDNNNVYIAGIGVNAQGYTIAKYWKNGEEIILADEGTTNAYAYDIFVKNNDVYVIGEKNYKSYLWKNGETVELITGNRTFYNTSVFVK